MPKSKNDKQWRVAYYQAHPEKRLEYQITGFSNFLRKHGYIVIKDQLPPPPWDELTGKFVLQILRANMEGMRYD